MASEMTPARRKRVNRLKKFLLFGMPLLGLVLFVGCIVLAVLLTDTKHRLTESTEANKAYETAMTTAMDENDRMRRLLDLSASEKTEERPGQTTSTVVAEDPSEEPAKEEEVGGSGTRKVYLTFDDGPSIYTDEILDILAEYDVKATFFVVGNGKEEYADKLKRIADEGHTLGMHSYSHVYRNVYGSLAEFGTDLQAVQDFIFRETGEKSKYFRFPGGSSNNIASAEEMQQYIAYLKALGIEYYDWNVSSGDAVAGGLSAEEITSRVLSQVNKFDSCIVLLHDSGDKHSTVNALRSIIPALLESGNTELLPITEETLPEHHVELTN